MYLGAFSFSIFQAAGAQNVQVPFLRMLHTQNVSLLSKLFAEVF